MSVEIRTLDAAAEDFGQELDTLLSATSEPDSEVNATVMGILDEVRRRGDDALVEFTNRFDRRQVTPADIEISPDEMSAALSRTSPELVSALRVAAERVRDYHQRQLSESWSYRDEDGTMLGQKVTPIDRAGVYVPGGKAAYPSSVLMNVIPARVAGVREVIMVVPTPDDEANDMVLAAANIAGVDRVFSIGGAQAVAALAYGTELVPAVDKIVGPGNKYVAAAKRLVFGHVGIDMIAGPSEVLIISDGSGDADWVAMDMFAQAEHDEDARSFLVCTDASFIDAVKESIQRLLPTMERADIIRTSLQKNGCIISVSDLGQAAEISDLIAPEHLELSVKDAESLLEKIHHAGAIFMGHYSAEVLGDYCAGPNHVLPTARTARFSSPLGVYDFQKRSSLIMTSETSAQKLAATASVLARGEGLTAHARSAELRLKS